MSTKIGSASQQSSSSKKKYEWSKLDDNGKKKVHREILETITIVIRLKDIVNEYDGLRLEYWESGEHHGDNPLHLAAFHGHLMIVKFLMEEVSFYKESTNRYRNTPLHRAAKQGHLSIVRYLVKEKKCDAMCKCNWGRTPLHIACCHDHIDVVKFLMEVKCVEVNVRDKKGDHLIWLHKMGL